MTQNKLQIFDHDKIVSTALTDDNQGSLYHFSGLLNRERERAGLRFFGIWICAACRQGKMIVTVQYTSGADSVYEVTPGFPLMVESEVGEVNLAVTNVKFTPVGDSVEVELSLLRSDRLVSATIPQEGLILALTAESGVSTGGLLEGEVLSWEPQQGLTASDLFIPSGTGPNLQLAVDGFNGYPGLVFDGTQSLGYSGPNSDFAALAAGGFTIVVIHKPSDQLENIGALLSTLVSAADAGIQLEMTADFEVSGRLQNGAGFSLSQSTHEPIERLMVSTFYASYGTMAPVAKGVLEPGTQSRVKTRLFTAQSPAAAVTKPLTIGDTPFGSGGAEGYKGVISDIYIYEISIGLEAHLQIASYVAQRFNADLSYYTNFAHENTYAYITAQRGVTTVDGRVKEMGGATVGASVAIGNYDTPLPQTATSGAGTGALVTFDIGAGPELSGLVIVSGGQDFNYLDEITFLGPADIDAVKLIVLGVNAGAVTEWKNKKSTQGEFVGNGAPVLVNGALNGKRSVRFAVDLDDALHFERGGFPIDWGFLTGQESFIIAGVTRLRSGAVVSNSDSVDGTGAGMDVYATSGGLLAVAQRNDYLGDNVVTTVALAAPAALYQAFVYRWTPAGGGQSFLNTFEGQYAGGIHGSPVVRSTEDLHIGGAVAALFQGDIVELQVRPSDFWDDVKTGQFLFWARSKYDV